MCSHCPCLLLLPTFSVSLRSVLVRFIPKADTNRTESSLRNLKLQTSRKFFLIGHTLCSSSGNRLSPFKRYEVSMRGA